MATAQQLQARILVLNNVKAVLKKEIKKGFRNHRNKQNGSCAIGCIFVLGALAALIMISHYAAVSSNLNQQLPPNYNGTSPELKQAEAQTNQAVGTFIGLGFSAVLFCWMYVCFQRSSPKNSYLASTKRVNELPETMKNDLMAIMTTLEAVLKETSFGKGPDKNGMSVGAIIASLDHVIGIYQQAANKLENGDSSLADQLTNFEQELVWTHRVDVEIGNNSNGRNQQLLTMEERSTSHNIANNDNSDIIDPNVKSSAASDGSAAQAGGAVFSTAILCC